MKKLLLTLALIGVLVVILIWLIGDVGQTAYDRNLSLVKDIENSGNAKGGYWLEQKSMGVWAKEVLIFGYIDNYSACADFVQANYKKYGGTYRCTEIE